MDLSFPLPTPADAELLPAADMAAVAALLSSWQEASATARAQAALDGPAVMGEPLLAPIAGAFSPAMATLLAQWKHE